MIISGLAKLELEAMRIQEETGLNIEEAREVAKTIIKNRLTSEAPENKPSSSEEHGVQHDLTAERGCRELILRNWKTVKQLHGENASARQVLRIIERNIGKFEEAPDLKTVSNRMSELRNEKLIP